jgi:hypothetical protein
MKAASQGAIAALASVLLSAGSAQSADLGGNCCADLEERVAELEATSVRKGNRRVSLTLSGQVNRSLMYWNDGFQDDVYSVDNAISNSRFRLTGSAKISADVTTGFYMEFSMALGARSHQVSQIDDDGFAGSGGILGGAILGDGIGGAGDSVLDFNQSYWYVDSKHWGRLSVGRLSASTAGISIIDLSNTGVVANSQPFLWGGGMMMRSGAGSLAALSSGAATLTWGQMCGGPGSSAVVGVFTGAAGPYSTDCGIHALDRRDAVMYQTPTWHGFTFGGTFGEDDFWDVAGRYAGEWHGFRVAAGLGYRWYDDREPDVLVVGPPGRRLDDTHRQHWLTSVSLMHIATGLFVSGAWTQYMYEGLNPHEIFDLNPNRNRPDTNLWWVDAGIEKNWFGIGTTTFYGEYGRVDDGITGLVALPGGTGQFVLSGLGPLGARGVVADSEMTWWGVGAVQKIDAAAMDLYLAYRHYSADVVMGNSAVPAVGSAIQIPGGLEDIWYIQGGARIQF